MSRIRFPTPMYTWKHGLHVKVDRKGERSKGRRTNYQRHGLCLKAPNQRSLKLYRLLGPDHIPSPVLGMCFREHPGPAYTVDVPKYTFSGFCTRDHDVSSFVCWLLCRTILRVVFDGYDMRHSTRKPPGFRRGIWLSNSTTYDAQEHTIIAQPLE
jgi:hypothetical protein